MMGKMGFIQGGGLGKDGQGMAQPIEAIQRPKSLGLGVDFSNISGDSVKNKPQSIGTGTGTGTGKSRKHSKTQSFGAFEKHTKGFGSKMMARMGFVEGMGLGVDSQGIANPLVAVRRPKAWGLGAKG
ncbi:G-PATCH DOMAIN CONTAINING PROTEIN [Salix koriyanagi]|uniref:G-PATCH DOMAIN CONTAINING PROTEIN n=1 Tax=Salix koriyanagi TaxID=2511006 RepID=A0A9Q0ZTB9_9ROSI|nr:G-PATCH DOMAIN CONTAINING PROTEIN [Salix koriyanagi]